MQVLHDSIIIGHVDLASLPESDIESVFYEGSDRERRQHNNNHTSHPRNPSTHARLRACLSCVSESLKPPQWMLILMVVWIMYVSLMQKSLRVALGEERLEWIGKQVLLGVI